MFNYSLFSKGHRAVNRAGKLCVHLGTASRSFSAEYAGRMFVGIVDNDESFGVILIKSDGSFRDNKESPYDIVKMETEN